MTFFIIFITAVFIFLIGYLIIELCGFLKGGSLLEKLSYSWGLGVGLIGTQLFIYSLLNIAWSRISILLPWVMLCIIFLVRTRPLPKIEIKKIKLKLSMIEIFFLLLIALLLIFTGVESIIRPIQAWDGWVNWIFRPKVFFLHNNLDMDYIRYTYNDYPLIIPLMGTFGYIMAGGINDTYILFLFFIFYLALGGVFFAISKKLLNTKLAIVLTFLLLSLQNLIRHGGRFEVGQADLALGYYIIATIGLLINFLKTKDKKMLLLLSLFLGFTGQIKEDGIPFFVIINLILLYFILIWKKYSHIFAMLPAVFLLGLWDLYKILNHYPPSLLFRDIVHIHWDKVGAILLAMTKEFINFQNWSILWIVFLIALIFSWRRIATIKLFVLVFFLQLLSYFIVYMITPGDPVYRVEGTIDRLCIHLAPLAVLIIGLLLKPEFIAVQKLLTWKKGGKSL
jgi:hypothetical protein